MSKHIRKTEPQDTLVGLLVSYDELERLLVEAASYYVAWAVPIKEAENTFFKLCKTTLTQLNIRLNSNATHFNINSEILKDDLGVYHKDWVCDEGMVLDDMFKTVGE